jgi:ATP adenylyltransferase
VKYRVLTRARGRCECCGAHEHQQAPVVDHIIPRNQGGSDDITNLQALCFRCNAGKGDTDRTDFRDVLASYGQRQEGCVFCALEGTLRVTPGRNATVNVLDISAPKRNVEHDPKRRVTAQS